MQITIINDCCDENAKLRQVSRAGFLIKNSSVNCFGVKSEFEAAGFLVDAIDAFEGGEGIILANVAPRGGKGKKCKNGAPFGFFWHKKTLIVSSIDGLALSLAKKLGIIKEFHLVDIDKVLTSIKGNGLGGEEKGRIIKSQFRSFDFLPRLAAWIVEGKKLPALNYDLTKIPETPHLVWFIDNFGNIKTTLLKEELILKRGSITRLKIGNRTREFNFYNHLKDMPDKSLGIVIGSSGIDGKRFVEIILRGGNAAKKLGIEASSAIKI